MFKHPRKSHERPLRDLSVALLGVTAFILLSAALFTASWNLIAADTGVPLQIGMRGAAGIVGCLLIGGAAFGAGLRPGRRHGAR